jgi:hypothetical protein
MKKDKRNPRKIVYQCPLSSIRGIDIGLDAKNGRIHEGDIVKRDSYMTYIVKFGYYTFDTDDYSRMAAYGFYLQQLKEEGIIPNGDGGPFFEPGYGEPDEMTIIGSIYSGRDKELNDGKRKAPSYKYIDGVEEYDFEKREWRDTAKYKEKELAKCSKKELIEKLMKK